MSSNKVAIVTGANKGLGLAVVKELCEKYDGTIYLTSRDIERGEKALRELRKQGYNPIYHQLDVTNPESVSTFLKYIQDNEQQVDIVINNAGILFLKDATETKYFQAEQTVYVNFTSLVNFTEAILPSIGNGGKIINVSSSSGHLSRIPNEDLRKKLSSSDLTLQELKGLMIRYVEDVKNGVDISKTWGDSPYVVSKVGVNAYTFMLHRRLASRGILVNCVHPGYVMSDMTRGGGSVTPEQAAAGPLRAALQAEGGGLYLWHNGTVVPWDGPDPRGYIDGIV